MKKEGFESVTLTTKEKTEEKIIYLLDDGEEKYYKLLGRASGINFNHCFTLGMKHKENFWNSVFAHKISTNREQTDMIEQTTGEKYIAIEFYELNS